MRCLLHHGKGKDRSIRPHPLATGLTVARSTCALSEREREREREREINYQTSASQTLQKPLRNPILFPQRVTKLLVVSIYEVSYGSGRPHHRHGHRIDKGNVGKPGRVQPNTRPSRYGPSQSVDGWLVSKTRPRQPQLHAVLLSISTARGEYARGPSVWVRGRSLQWFPVGGSRLVESGPLRDGR